VALVLGAASYFAVLYRFQTYSQRNATSQTTWIVFSAIMFVLGVVLGWVASTSFLRTGTFMVLGVFAAHSVVIYLDTMEDPTNHNLLPFEFIIYFVLSSPAYLGVLMSRIVKRFSQ